MSTHRWSGWPGAFCLDCGKEDGEEIDIAGPPEETHHRYSRLPHTSAPCRGCARRHEPCLRGEEGADKYDNMTDYEEHMAALGAACPICGMPDLFIGRDGRPGCPHCEVAVKLQATDEGAVR